MELVLTLPILGLVLLAMLEFTLLFYSRSLVVEASRAGARRATLAGTTQTDIEQEVHRILTPQLRRGMAVDAILGNTAAIWSQSAWKCRCPPRLPTCYGR